jgi:hypothetical protein
VLTGNAQSIWFLEGGVNSSNYYSRVSGQKYYSGEKWGGRFGIGLDVRISNHLYVLPGFHFMMNGYNQNTAKGDLTYSINTLEVPFNLVYKMDKPKGNRLIVGIGPYVALNMFGQRKYTPMDSSEYTWQLNIGTDARDDMRMFDVGLGVLGGYEFEKGLFFRIYYQIGLNNMSQIQDEYNYLKSKASGITIGYNIGAKKAYRKEWRGVRKNGIVM